jgi:hypothetical protein
LKEKNTLKTLRRKQKDIPSWQKSKNKKTAAFSTKMVEVKITKQQLLQNAERKELLSWISLPSENIP